MREGSKVIWTGWLVPTTNCGRPMFKGMKTKKRTKPAPKPSTDLVSDLAFYSNHLLASAVPPAKKDWGFEHLQDLHKATCVDFVKNPKADHGDEEYGLVFRCRDGKIRTAWILCDPEGNGAGHLDIVESGK